MCYTGSRAYGMAAEDADHDVVGVFAAPKSHYLGLYQVAETVRTQENNVDITHYELRHFVRLLLRANPNLLWTLWTEEPIFNSSLFFPFIEQRHLFLSKRAYNSHVRYAERQFEKLIRSVQDSRETLKKLDELDKEIALHEDHADVYLTHRLRETDRLKATRDILRLSINGLGLGDKRRDVIIAHGYDTNQAAHLIRLLRMGVEFLVDGRTYVDRSDNDAEQLLAIKAGEYPLEEITKLVEVLMAQAERAHERSILPEDPDYRAVDELLMHTIEEATK